MKFAKWLEQQQQQEVKPWKGKKKDILAFWQGLPNQIPIIPSRPIPPDHKGSTYTYDGLRVTGSQQFINSILSRTKDIINYDAENSNLDLIYQQQVDKTSGWPLPNSFVFYVQVQDKRKEDELPRVT